MSHFKSQKIYSNAIKKYGTTVKALCWRDEDSQRIRFQQIALQLPNKLQNATLCDAGCGFGDFYSYLKEQKKEPALYVGIDAHIQMCEIARQKTKQKILHANICSDALPVHDYYVASGSLNLLSAFEAHMFIQKCFAHTKKLFIFNLLTKTDTSPLYNTVTKEELLRLAKVLGVANVSFYEGYLDDDMTVCFYR